jgi:hypothetical protein
MVQRAATPFFPELDEAYHDYAVLANFTYGKYSGELISRREELQGVNQPQHRPALDNSSLHDSIPSAIERYFHCMSSGDTDSWLALFNSQGQLIDAGSRPFTGESHLRIFIETFRKTFPKVSASFCNPRIGANTATVDWTYEVTSYNDVDMRISGTEEFTFDESGLILKAVAFWNPEDLASQLRSGLKLAKRDPSRTRH